MTAIGWDIGGAHVKAAVLAEGLLREVVQWPCALWQGQDRLDAVLREAAQRWPLATAAHAVTMTGEMVDLFATRAAGVQALVAQLRAALGPQLRFFGGDGRWLGTAEAAHAWRQIASANWAATAAWVARALPDAMLVDIGSTTTDLVPVRQGRVVARGDTDAARLALGELVYQGVIRTPLCCLAQRIAFDDPRGPLQTAVMNEWFATTGDVYRLTGELDPDHDQQPTADNGPRDAAGSRQRLARMIGRDAPDAPDAAWLALARRWRDAQLAQLRPAFDDVLRVAGLGRGVPVVAAGCGAFLAAAVAPGHPVTGFDRLLPIDRPAVADWARVCAPAAALAMLAAAPATRAAA